MGVLAYLGFALLAENWFIALMAVVSFIVLAIRVPREEKLVEKFVMLPQLCQGHSALCRLG
jgi:protein-S-isoprenylcysteine O-methyltransferase Ste14